MRDPFADKPVVLTDDQRERFQEWVDVARTMLGLATWQITVSPHAASDDALATSWIRDHADESVIALCSEWRDWTNDEVRSCLTHELLHPHFQRVTGLAAKLVESELGKRTEAVIEAAVREAEEQVIDRLARAVAKLLPPLEVPT